MASLREIRRKIKSVKSTEQITKAMKMVAAARMRRAQQAILAARPFAVRLDELCRGLAERIGKNSASDWANSPTSLKRYFQSNSQGASLIVLVAADKGLCGAFNSNLIRASLGWMQRQNHKFYAITVGRKSRDFFKRLRGFDCEVLHEMAGIFPKVSFTHAEILGQEILKAYFEKNLSSVIVLYNEFKSVAQQKLVEFPILPIAPLEKALPGSLVDYEFEPKEEVLLEALLPRYLKAQIYRILLESQAAELSARMNAMDAASKNAKDIRASLNLSLNRQRQAMITKEIAELVGGAEALAS
jgi:F-type H+-transporting ATPase subunit gamma